jgi:hypothetical protein
MTPGLDRVLDRIGRGARAAPALLIAVLAAPTVSSAAAPKGVFASFSACPLDDPIVEECVVARTTSGELSVGRKTVSIVAPIMLEGGWSENERRGVQRFVGARGRPTLSKTPQPVSGGLAAVVSSPALPAYVRNLVGQMASTGLGGVSSTTELAGPPGAIALNTNNALSGEGIALAVPVKVHLENPFLGASCYVGSEAQPMKLALTTGVTDPPSPNHPIKGRSGRGEVKEEGAYVILRGNALVSNSFAAPAATGCGGELAALVTPAVNAKLGLPAPAGRNTAILEGSLEQAAALAVKRSR